MSSSDTTQSGGPHAARDLFDFSQATLNIFGPANVGGGIDEAALRRILDDFLAHHTVAPVPSVRNNFGDAKIVWNRLFTGRADELARLHTALVRKSQVISHAVTGAGGVGKTELARAYAFLFANEFAGVWWLDASDEGFSNALARAFKSVTGTDAPGDTRPEVLAAHLGQHWSKAKHLIILDNLESAQRIDLFGLGGDCRVLATTRRDLVAAAIIEPFRVDVLSETAAVDLLTRQTSQRKAAIARTDLDRVANTLACHSLAVALAGAYLARYGDVTADEYIAAVAKTGSGEAAPRGEGEENDPLLLRYRHSVRASLSLHFARFAGKPEMTLLALAAFCHASDIPLDLLATAANIDLPTCRTQARNLADLSILHYDRGLSMHRLTQLVVRSMLDADSRDKMIDALLSALNPEFDDSKDHTRWPRRSVLAAHADAVIGHAAADHVSQDAGRLANDLGLYLQQAGRYPEAQRTHETCLQLTAKTFGADQPNMAALLSNLAAVQKSQGDLAGARASMERAIAIDGKHFAPDHPTFATSYSNLALIQQAQGDLAGARASMERAIDIEQKHFAPDHPTFATRYSNLATIQYNQGDLAGARASMERAIDIEQKHFAPDHPTFATSYSNLALIQQAQGDLAGARASMERAIAIMAKHYGPDHPHLAVTYNNLAHIAVAQGKIPEAVALWRKSYAIRLKALGPDHPDTKDVAAALRHYDPPGPEAR